MSIPSEIVEAITAETLQEELPIFGTVLGVTTHGSPGWSKTFKVDTTKDGEEAAYFMKVNCGEHGMKALNGEFESTLSIHAIVGDFTPKPIAWGSFRSIPDTHYYICKFYELASERPEPSKFCANLAKLHKNSEAPNGKFGFHIVTYNGNLPQENGYTDTWEKFFINEFEHMLNLNVERGGPWEEMESLKKDMLGKTALVHGDLWHGNTAVDVQTGSSLIYDPASFYAHNEYELGNWLPGRNKFSQAYSHEYHLHIPKSIPTEDYHDRIELYAMRFNIQADALYSDFKLRKSIAVQMRRLIAKYPEGYEG